MNPDQVKLIDQFMDQEDEWKFTGIAEHIFHKLKAAGFSADEALEYLQAKLKDELEEEDE